MPNMQAMQCNAMLASHATPGNAMHASSAMLCNAMLAGKAMQCTARKQCHAMPLCATQCSKIDANALNPKVAIQWIY